MIIIQQAQMSTDGQAPEVPNEKHYVDVAAAYEEAFFYESGPYQEHLIRTLLPPMQASFPFHFSLP